MLRVVANPRIRGANYDRNRGLEAAPDGQAPSVDRDVALRKLQGIHEHMEKVLTCCSSYSRPATAFRRWSGYRVHNDAGTSTELRDLHSTLLLHTLDLMRNH